MLGRSDRKQKQKYGIIFPSKDQHHASFSRQNRPTRIETAMTLKSCQRTETILPLMRNDNAAKY